MDVFSTKVSIIGQLDKFAASIIIYNPVHEQDHKQAQKALHLKERCFLDSLGNENRKISYLYGRYAAKMAVSTLVNEKNLNKIQIYPGIFGQPNVSHSSNQNIGITISHCDHLIGAIAFIEGCPMGIDLEETTRTIPKYSERFLTSKGNLTQLELPFIKNIQLIIIWTIKEALSKAIRTGFTSNMNIFDISKCDVNNNYIESLFTYFPQFKALSIVSNKHICSIVYPGKLEALEAEKLKEYLE